MVLVAFGRRPAGSRIGSSLPGTGVRLKVSLTFGFGGGNGSGRGPRLNGSGFGFGLKPGLPFGPGFTVLMPRGLGLLLGPGRFEVLSTSIWVNRNQPVTPSPPSTNRSPSPPLRSTIIADPPRRFGSSSSSSFFRRGGAGGAVIPGSA